MSAAALRARVKRSTALIEGLGKEAEAVRADRRDLTLQEWNRYLTALYNVKDALHDARSALQGASDRIARTANGRIETSPHFDRCAGMVKRRA
jgi:hypothetical protein